MAACAVALAILAGCAPSRSATTGDPLGLPDTSLGIHAAQIFNFNIARGDLGTETGAVDIVWGSESASQPPGVANTYYIPFDRDNHGQTLAWFEANHPDWVEFRCNEATPAYSPGDTTDVPLDITNPAARAYILQTYLVPMLNAGYRGIAFDSVAFDNPGERCGHFTSKGVWVGQYTGGPTDPAFRQSVLAWAGAIYRSVHAAKAGALVAMNFTDDAAQPDASAALFKDMDIDLDERGFTNFGTPGDAVLTDSVWHENLVADEALAAAGKALISINEEPDAFAQLTSDEKEWALANYLLVKGSATYVAILGRQEYGALLVLPEYGTKVGAATSGVKPSDGDGAYERDFTNAVVFVNPSAANTDLVTVPDGTFRDLETNAPVSGDVTLAPHTGLVLVGH